jgi:hypothetical protein
MTMFPVRMPVPIHGVRRDVAEWDLPPTALRDSRNWGMFGGRFKVRPGMAAVGSSVAERPSGLIQYVHANDPRMTVMGTSTGWWMFNHSTESWLDITDRSSPLTAGATYHNIFRVFNKSGTDYLLGVNGKDTPKKWDGNLASDYAAIGGSPPNAKIMVIAANRVVMGLGKTLSVSAFNDMDSGWGSAQTILLADTPGEIVAGLEIGNLAAAIYKEDAIHVLRAQSGKYPFAQQLAASGIVGPASPASVVSLPSGLHLYLATDGSIQVFDGSRPRSVGEHIQNWISEVADLSDMKRCHACYDKIMKMALFFFPLVGSDTTHAAAGISVREDGSYALFPLQWPHDITTAGLIIRDTSPSWEEISELYENISATWESYSSDVPRLFLCRSTGQVYEAIGNNDAGSAISHHFETGVSDLGDQRRYKTIHVFDPLFKGGGDTVNVQISSSDAGADPELSAAQTVVVSATSLMDTGHRVSARAVGVRVSGSSSNGVEYLGATVEATMEGKR